MFLLPFVKFSESVIFGLKRCMLYVYIYIYFFTETSLYSLLRVLFLHKCIQMLYKAHISHLPLLQTISRILFYRMFANFIFFNSIIVSQLTVLVTKSSLGNVGSNMFFTSPSSRICQAFSQIIDKTSKTKSVRSLSLIYHHECKQIMQTPFTKIFFCMT